MIKINKWTTEKGTTVELHTQHVTEEHIGTDEWTGKAITKPADEIRIVKMIVNGETYESFGASRSSEQGFRAIYMGHQKMGGKTILMYIPLPVDVEKDVWGAYDERQAARRSSQENRRKAEEKKLKQMIANGYCLKCRSYCYGDCES